MSDFLTLCSCLVPMKSEGFIFPGPGVNRLLAATMMVLESSVDLLQEQQMLLTTEPSLYHPLLVFPSYF